MSGSPLETTGRGHCTRFNKLINHLPWCHIDGTRHHQDCNYGNAGNVCGLEPYVKGLATTLYVVMSAEMTVLSYGSGCTGPVWWVNCGLCL